MDAERGVPVSHSIYNASAGEFEPLYIRNVVLDSGGYQSSPFPCDSNRITVRVVPNFDIVVSCSPQVILSGLVSTADSQDASLSNQHIEVLLENNGVAKGVVSATYASGTLVFAILQATPLLIEDKVLAGEALVFDFTLINPTASQDPVLPSIAMQLSTLNLDATNQSAPPHQNGRPFGHPLPPAPMISRFKGLDLRHCKMNMHLNILCYKSHCLCHDYQFKIRTQPRYRCVTEYTDKYRHTHTFWNQLLPAIGMTQPSVVERSILSYVCKYVQYACRYGRTSTRTSHMHTPHTRTLLDR